VSTGADPKACTCMPSYYGVVWDRAVRKHRKTRRFRGVMEARNARKDLAAAMSEGKLPGVAGPRWRTLGISSSGRRARGSR
jgi:hypothetical protein